MVIYLSLLVALIGLIMFLAFRNNGDVKRIGEILFFCGTLAFLITFPRVAEHVFSTTSERR